PDPAAALTRVLAAAAVLLVLRGQRHGEPRPPRCLRVLLRCRCAAGEPVPGLGTALGRIRPGAAPAHALPRGAAQRAGTGAGYAAQLPPGVAPSALAGGPA